jgi:hypothetical protein
MYIYKKARIYVTVEEDHLLDGIIKRISNIAPNRFDEKKLKTDLTVVHLKFAPLNLLAMFNGKDKDLLHDVVGITRNISKSSGKLNEYFMPRFSKERRNEA